MIHLIQSTYIFILIKMLKSFLILLEEWLGPGYYHIVIEIGLIFAVYQLFTTRPKRPKTANSILSEKERQQLIGKSITKINQLFKII